MKLNINYKINKVNFFTCFFNNIKSGKKGKMHGSRRSLSQTPVTHISKNLSFKIVLTHTCLEASNEATLFLNNERVTLIKLMHFRGFYVAEAPLTI